MAQLGSSTREPNGSPSPSRGSSGTTAAEWSDPAHGARYVHGIDLEADRVLVERFQSGDETAFAELYSRHFQRLYRSCLRCLGDPATAEDAAQEAFARAFRALPSLTGERRFFPWLSVIAKRLCIDVHRQRARNTPVEELDPGRTEDGEDAVVASMEAAVLHEGLARLSSRHREILLLREFEGWSYRRIASHYRLTLAAVETLLWRARRALHRELTQSGYERRALVGIPVVGWMYRRLGSMKVRLAEWGGSRLAPLIGGAASAVTIGCLVLGGVGSAGHPGRPVTVSSRPSTAGAPARTSAPQPSTAAQVPAATTAGGAAGGGDPAKGPAGPAGGGRAVLGASFSDAGSASQQARQQPVHASGVGVAVGVDPKAATSDLIRQTTGLTQLPRSVP